MKNLLKITGLILLSFVLFAGCSHDATPISTSEVNLTDGSWEMYQKTSFSFTDAIGNCSIYYAIDVTLPVKEGTATYHSVIEEESTSITFKSKEFLETYKGLMSTSTGEEVSVSGNTLTTSKYNMLNHDETKVKYNISYKADHLEKYFEGAKIKTNKDRTRYILTYNTKQSYLGEEYDANVKITLKKW